ncbi:YcaO-like family protein [Streptomyces sp. NPDC006235]|uniref:YcaO-like family protein n=1 Tax=Streptomyces sp. NPDC006235 TaxID=3156736 RepID=UPI0033BE5A41
MSICGLPSLLSPSAECPSCKGLWAAEAGSFAVTIPALSPASVVHPDCLEHPRGDELRVSLTSPPEGVSVHAPYGPLIGQQVIEDPDAGLWSSDVVLTVPGGTRGYPAMVGGGVASTADDALTLGWIEALERRCSLRRPRGQLVFAGRPPGPTLPLEAAESPTWWAAAHTLDGSALWLPLQDTVLASQWRGGSPCTTDSTGMSAHTSKESAIFHGLRECVERAGLHQWWTQQGSRRCSDHSLVATALLHASTLALPQSDCEAWHVRLGRWQVAGCLIFTETKEGFRAAFGAGAALGADAAVRAAWREAFQMHTAPQLTVARDGQLVFGAAIGHTLIDDDFRARFLRDFPTSPGCLELAEAGTDPTERDEVDSLLKAIDRPVATVDTGDELTDALGLHVLRVICPGMPKFTPGTRAPSGLTPAFLGG